MTAFNLRPSRASLGSLAKPRPRVQWVSPSATEQAFSMFLGTTSGVILVLLLTIVLVSPLQHAAAQAELYSQLRLALAEGSAPTGPVTDDGELVAPGTPVAVLSAPSVGIEREVIVEGTASAQTMVGIGHRRDTALPCQEGASVLMARAAAYGGSGGTLATMRAGQRVEVTMSQTSCVYEILGQRNVGDDAPPAPREGEGRITFTTAAGLPFMPTEVLRIDAELVDEPVDRPAQQLPAGALPSSEAAMGVDESALFGLVLLLQLLVAAVIATTWAWRRWGRWQTWIVGAPILVSVGLLCANSLNQWMLPNLL